MAPYRRLYGNVLLGLFFSIKLLKNLPENFNKMNTLVPKIDQSSPKIKSLLNLSAKISLIIFHINKITKTFRKFYCERLKNGVRRGNKRNFWPVPFLLYTLLVDAFRKKNK